MADILEQLKEKIQSKIGGLNYNMWFKSLTRARTENNTFYLVVPNKFIADWIDDYYGEVIEEEIFNLTKTNYQLAYDILPDKEDKAAAVSGSLQQHKLKSLDAFNPRYSFDRFVVGSSNQFAHAASRAVADLPGGKYNPLFLYGGVGLGKTHLLHAIGIHLSSKNPGMRIVLVGAERFMNELINALRFQKMPDFRKKYRDTCDILLIDDIQFIGGKETTQDEFFHTFNTLHDTSRQIVITGDKPPAGIQGMEERLCSRLGWGLVADIGPPDLETRIAILRKKADVSDLFCPDDVAMFLASSIKSNVRELEGSLIRINAFASLTGAQITIDFAREVIGNIVDEGKRLLTIEAVQRVVADFYKINVSDLKSPRRQRSFAHPRQVAMYLCKKHVHSSFPEIGNRFGGKDHTTVMHACRKVEKQMEFDPAMRSDVTTLEKTILG